MDKKLIKLLLVTYLMESLMCSELHWQINWLDESNSYGTYATKQVLPRLQKLDAILQSKVKQLEEEIRINFQILMGITSMMTIILAMSLHACYMACKTRLDSALPPQTIEPNVSRLPLVRPVENSTTIEMTALDVDHDLKPKWVERPIYQCRSNS